MKRQLSRLTFSEKRQKENTTMKTDYPSSREKNRRLSCLHTI